MDYLNVYLDKEPFGQLGEAQSRLLEVCVAIVDHGYGAWVYYSDTGYQYEIFDEPDLVYQESFDIDGNNVELTKREIDIVLEIANETYWEKYSDNVYA